RTQQTSRIHRHALTTPSCPAYNGISIGVGPSLASPSCRTPSVHFSRASRRGEAPAGAGPLRPFLPVEGFTQNLPRLRGSGSAPWQVSHSEWSAYPGDLRAQFQLQTHLRDVTKLHSDRPEILKHRQRV